MTSYDTPPANLNALQARLNNITGDRSVAELIKRTLACVVVAQMLPAGLVKGGAAMRIRLGATTTRFSLDLDVARHPELDAAAFIADLQQRLEQGWAGFTGRIVTRTPPSPAGVPSVYVMRPYDLKLSFAGRSWLTLPLELGHDELGDTDRPDEQIATDVVDLFTQLGLPEPRPIPLLAIEDQVAQKIHACTAPGSERAHDLVDLQLLDTIDTGIDLVTTAHLSRRLFRSRGTHDWPPTVTPGPLWTDLYREAADGLPVLQDLDDATAWTQDLIDRIARIDPTI